MKTLYIALGTLSLALGILGIFLPLLPTTPFLLLTAALYFKSSPRLYNWLLNQKHLGPYIRNFRENKSHPSTRKDNFHLADVDHHALLRIFYRSIYVGKSNTPDYCSRSNLSYPFI